MSQRPARRRQRRTPGERPARQVDYHRLRNPFVPQPLYTDDQIEQIHATALRVLREVGVRVLLDEARELLAKAGCRADGDKVVRFDDRAVAAAVESAPARFDMLGARPETAVRLGDNRVVWTPAGGIPHISDLERGKRPATLVDWESYSKLTEYFDVLHVNSSGPEPQDVAPALRHYATTAGALRLTGKVPFIYSRGRQQVQQSFQLIRIARGLSEERFRAGCYCYTVINTNSPLQLDIPMAQGTIDFARAGQMACITPFTLAGAMAPVTLAGALVQQHAEFLAALTVHQLAQPGAPAVYGGFTSNVDMKSGAPAFGTPENVRGALATGQLARRLDIPWRSSMSSTSNAVDAQAAYETAQAMWGSLLGGANLTLHAAGWMEGGLTASLEKLVIDCELLQQAAELMQPPRFDADELAFEAIAAVGQGGHYFGQPHTMQRYQTAFYQPLVSDWSNFGQWTENGCRDAARRAHTIWRDILDSFTPPVLDTAVDRELNAYIERHTAAGGAPPVS